MSVCDIVELQPTDTLTVHFTVTVPANDQDGHLGGYEMWADYGASLRFHIGRRRARGAVPGARLRAPPGASSRRIRRARPSRSARRTRQALVQGAPRPHWYGGNYKVTLRGCDFPVCCAYDIYLHAWKRTCERLQLVPGGRTATSTTTPSRFFGATCVRTSVATSTRSSR